MTDSPEQGKTSKSFRIAVWLFAIVLLGLIAWTTKNNLSESDQHSAKGLTLVLVAWVGVFAFCVLLLLIALRVQDFLQALAAVALPLAVVLGAGYLLFLNDQGRELGTSLMIGDRIGLWRLVLLFFALIYWGVNNWHSARLGIHAALERGELGVPPLHPLPKEPQRHVLETGERWLLWLPRLLGVFAHLFAAVHLSLAAWRQPAPPQWSWWAWTVVAWTAPFVILLFTALAYEFDRSAISKRYDRAHRPLRSYAELAAGGLIFVAMTVLSVLESYRPESYRPLRAFVLGTFTISLSAFIFLVLVSWLRRDKLLGPNVSMEERAKDDAKEKPRLVLWTFGLFSVAVAIALAVWINPTMVGWAFGSMVVAYSAMGALLATANAFHYGVRSLVQSDYLGSVRKPRVVSASIAGALILLAVVNAWLHPFHRVRLCADESCAKAALAADHSVGFNSRPTVEQAARAWYQQAKTAFKNDHPDWDENGDVPVPMLIVATAGGGIRAAYWTAAVLDNLRVQSAGSVRPYLFAVSGVSGGSVGATAFEAALAKDDEGQCGRGCCPTTSATSFLTEDFLAPVLASGIFIDTVASFLPEFPHTDRGVALEKSFEQASGGLLARSFLSLFRYGEDGAIRDSWRPILLLNATHEETGRRIIASPVLIERNVFLDSFDELNELGGDVRASTAAHNSARFAYVSPAGDIGDHKGSMIDGGYFENYGALTALELARAAEKALNPQGQKPVVKLVFLLISSDPDLDDPSPDKRTAPVRIDEPTGGDRCLVSITERKALPPASPGDPNFLRIQSKQVEDAWINEFVAPLHGLENARSAQGNWAAAQLAVKVCAAFSRSPNGKPGESAANTAPLENPASLEVPAATIASTETSYVAPTVHSASADENRPYFAHVAMCRGDDNGDLAVNPPLGWVLSETTRDGLDDMLCRCGNTDQIIHLKKALSLPGGWTCKQQQETSGLSTWADAPQRYSASP
jgi:hypothetical protein